MDGVDQEQPEPAQPLSNAEVERALGALPGWRREEGGIRKRFRRASFRDAIAFVNQIAELSERAGHHPDIDIRWRNVIIFLTTHEAGGVTHLDLELARQIEEVE
ncbi:MAG: 4a-hydroxytetrahydrobiopterin dehydratase [Chloroflexota bacterium]|nr:4a-hydroxytetrahydrobiopterin dehydratase [Chloroflexota bacterium]